MSTTANFGPGTPPMFHALVFRQARIVASSVVASLRLFL
jgi:hypothetical protein